jgi:hypothetical protein
MEVVFGKTTLDKTYEKAIQVSKENNNKVIEYVILSDQEFEECVEDVPLRNVVSFKLSRTNSISELFYYYGIYFIKQIPLDYIKICMRKS